MIRNLFRYRLTAIYFIIGQLIIYIAIFGALNIYNQILIKEKEKNMSIYNNRVQVEVTSVYEKDILNHACDDIVIGNAILGDNLAVDFRELNAKYKADVILGINEPLKYKMFSGRIPGTEQSDEGLCLVALGKNKYKAAYERNGKKYVTLNYEEYEVVGILGGESDYWDNKIVMNIKCMGEYCLSKILENTTYQISIGSDNDKLEKTYEKLAMNILNADNSVNINGVIDNSKSDNIIYKGLTSENFEINIMVYVFCLINDIIISEFWITQRKKEIAIRKAFGMSNFTIGKILLKDILFMMIFALALFGVGAFVVQGFDIKVNLINLCVVAIMILLTSIVSVIYPFWKVVNMKSAECVR